MQRHLDAGSSFDPTLLDALALCFAEAVVDQLIAEQLTEAHPVEIHSMPCHAGDVRTWLDRQYPNAG